MSGSEVLPAWRRCDVSVTLDVLRGRWKAVILFSLLSGARRFSEMQRFIPGVTQKILAEQVRELEADGIVFREVFPTVPPKVEYSLTERGRTLEPVLLTMRSWGGEHRGHQTMQAGDALRP